VEDSPEDICEELERRDRFLRNRWHTLTPSQRLQGLDELQRRGWWIIMSSPGGYDRFLRRNLKARAVDPDTGAPDVA
jgi:hypothetical protein